MTYEALDLESLRFFRDTVEQFVAQKKADGPRAPVGQAVHPDTLLALCDAALVGLSVQPTTPVSPVDRATIEALTTDLAAERSLRIMRDRLVKQLTEALTEVQIGRDNYMRNVARQRDAVRAEYRSLYHHVGELIVALDGGSSERWRSEVYAASMTWAQARIQTLLTAEAELATEKHTAAPTPGHAEAGAEARIAELERQLKKRGERAQRAVEARMQALLMREAMRASILAHVPHCNALGRLHGCVEDAGLPVEERDELLTALRKLEALRDIHAIAEPATTPAFELTPEEAADVTPADPSTSSTHAYVWMPRTLLARLREFANAPRTAE